MTEKEIEFDGKRDRGILTKDDREYLTGEKEYSNKQSEIDARYRIRNRVKNSILDFTILLVNLPEKDREQIFHSNTPDENQQQSLDEFQKFIKQTKFVRGIEHALGFIYMGVSDLDWEFEKILEAGIRNAEEKQGRIVDDVSVNVRINYSEPDVDELINRFQNGDELTAEEIRTLIRSGEFDIGPDVLDKIFKEMSEELSEELEDGNLSIDYDDST